MEQKSTTGARRGRGRPRSFDQDVVVEAAIEAFWAEGLEGTTLGDLEGATGIDRSTLYNSFGGKAGLYGLATTRYLERARAWLFEPLFRDSDDGVGDIVECLDRLKRGLTHSDAQPGCLIVNDMATNPRHEAGRRYRRVLTDGFRSALGRAGSAQAEERSRFLTAAVIGVNLLSRTGSTDDELTQAIDAMIGQVELWRS